MITRPRFFATATAVGIFLTLGIVLVGSIWSNSRFDAPYLPFIAAALSPYVVGLIFNFHRRQLFRYVIYLSLFAALLSPDQTIFAGKYLHYTILMFLCATLTGLFGWYTRWLSRYLRLQYEKADEELHETWQNLYQGITADTEDRNA